MTRNTGDAAEKSDDLRAEESKEEEEHDEKTDETEEVIAENSSKKPSKDTEPGDDPTDVAKQLIEVIVHSSVVIENSVKETLQQADLTALQNLIFREEHLKKNISRVEFGQYFTREIGRTFKHTLDMKLFVKARNLWEGPRSYIWKHFGRQEWSKPDGSKAVINRIHVK